MSSDSHQPQEVLTQHNCNLMKTNYTNTSPAPLQTAPNHFLLLLADSALPLTSFAFSSGLESFIAHTGKSASISSFLPISISSFASTTLPFLLAAHRDPASLIDLDDAYDASVMCTVARRASVTQGKGLLMIWQNSFSRSESLSRAEADSLSSYVAASRKAARSSPSSPSSSKTGGSDGPPPVSNHLAPLFGAISSVVGLSLQQTAFVFMLSHVKAVLGAAVKLSLQDMPGPAQAQKVLASSWVQKMIAAMVEREWDTPFEEAGQSVPVLDLWTGRHERIYTRLFAS